MNISSRLNLVSIALGLVFSTAVALANCEPLLTSSEVSSVTSITTATDFKAAYAALGELALRDLRLHYKKQTQDAVQDAQAFLVPQLRGLAQDFAQQLQQLPRQNLPEKASQIIQGIEMINLQWAKFLADLGDITPTKTTIPNIAPGPLSPEEFAARVQENFQKGKAQLLARTVPEVQDELWAAMENFDQQLALTMNKKIAHYQQEQATALARANEAILRKFLPILDNFDLTLIALSKEDPALVKDLVALVKAAHHQCLTSLQNVGLRPFQSLGEKYDAQFHRALRCLNDGADLIVVEEYQKGYLLHDRLLREALVVVDGASAHP